MTDVAEGFKDILVAAGVGTFGATSGWGIFIGKMPQSPETAVAITRSGGGTPSPKWLLDYPSVQVRVRGAAGEYQAAEAKALAVKNALLGIASHDRGGDRWVSVLMRGDISQMGWDEGNHPMFSLNFSLIIEPASGTHRQAL